jgi:hypothetical protein
VRVGWYVHHHGGGHAARMLACAPLLEEVVAFGSGPAPAGLPSHVRWIALAQDTADAPVDPTAGGALHWAPLGHDGHRRRLATIAAALEQEPPDVFVVDVSVEVAAFVRLLGVPTVVVAQRGRRTDAPHRLGHDLATAVVAPWTEATHQRGDGLPDDRLRFAGAISRFDDRPVPAPVDERSVLLLVGGGGHALVAADVAAAAAATPAWSWHVAGALRVDDPRVVDHGPRADVWSLLAEAAVVVGTAGGNVVAEVAAARRPLVCLPQERPFAEQERQADALAALAPVAVCRAWPPADRWPALLAEAAARDTSGWAVLHDGHGAGRLAAAIAEAGAVAG